MNYIFPQELGQRLINYLAQRPYSEVFVLIAELQNLPPVIPDVVDKSLMPGSED